MIVDICFGPVPGTDHMHSRSQHNPILNGCTRAGMAAWPHIQFLIFMVICWVLIIFVSVTFFWHWEITPVHKLWLKKMTFRFVLCL